MSSLKDRISVSTRLVAIIAAYAAVTVAFGSRPADASTNVTLSSISPTSVMATSPGFNLTVTGSNFSGGSKVYWGSSALSMTYVSSTQLLAHVNSSSLLQPGTVSVDVVGTNGVASASTSFSVIAAPSMSAISPTGITATASGCTLTVTGSHFYNDTLITWNRQPLNTTFVSSSELAAQITPAMVALPMTAQIAVAEPTGVGSGPIAFSIRPHANLASISPSSAMATSPGFSLGLTGSGFTSGSRITWNGQPLSTTYVSPTQLTAAIAASSISAPGTASVASTDTDGSASNPLTFTITANPTLTSISPMSAMATSPGLTVTVTGTNFVGSDKITWNGTPVSTTFVSNTQMQAFVSSNFLAAPGAGQIQVTTSAGILTGASTFTVVPAPSMTSLSPTGTTASSSGCTLTVTGSNFDRSTVITWNHQPLGTTYLSPSQISAQITSSMVASPMVAQVAVVEPTGVANGPLPFSVGSHATVAQISPVSALATSPGFTLQLTGNGFTTGTQIVWNGQPIPTTFVSSSQINGAVSPTLIAAVAPVTVSTVDSDGSASNPTPFTIRAAPMITSITPGVVTSRSTGITVNLTGANLDGSYKVTWNGSPLSCKFVSTTSMQPYISGSQLASAGSAVIQVVAPNGVVSNTTLFTVNPSPTVSGISPLSVIAGAPDTKVTVSGAKFIKGWTMQWNGVSIPTTWVSATKLSAMIPASDLEQPSTASVTVTSPDGIVSSPLPFGILVPAMTTGPSLWDAKLVWAHCMQHLTYNIPALGNSGIYGALYPLNLQNIDPSLTPQLDVQYAKASGIDALDVNIFTQPTGIQDYLTAADATPGFIVAPCIDLSVMGGANATATAMEDAVVQTVTTYATIAATHASAARDRGALVVWTYQTGMPLANWQDAVNRIAAAGVQVSWVADIEQAFSTTTNAFPQDTIDQMIGIFGAGYIWSAQRSQYWNQTVALYQQKSQNFCGDVFPGKDRVDGSYIDANGTQRMRDDWNRQFTVTDSNWVQISSWNSTPEDTLVCPSSDWNMTRSDLTQWYAAQFKDEPVPFNDLRLYVTSPKAVALNQPSSAEALVINPTSTAVTVRMTLYDGNGNPVSNVASATVAANSTGFVTLSTNFTALPAGRFVRAKAYVVNAITYVADATSAPVIVYSGVAPADNRVDYYSVPSTNALQGPVTLTMTPNGSGQEAATVTPPAGSNVQFAEILGNTVEVNNFYNNAPYSTTVPATSGTFYVARVIDQNKCVGYSDPVYIGP